MQLEEIKRNFNKTVKCRGNEYRLIECIFWYDKKDKKYKYSCTLHDLKSDSVIRVPMEMVEEQQ